MTRKATPPSHLAASISIRFPTKSMKARIKKIADSEGRSLNSQINLMLVNQLAEYDRSVA